MLDRCRDRRDRERQNGFLRLLFDAGDSLGYVGRFCVYIREIDQVKQEQAVVLRCNDQRIHCALRLRGKKISEKGYGFLLVPIQYMCIGVQREGYGVVAHDFRQCFRVHTLFHCSGGKRVTKRMEGEVAKPARLQELIVIILECTRFNYSPKRICYNIAACIVLISGKLRILLLNILPALQLLKDDRQKRNCTNGILTFRCLDHDFRCGLSGLQGPLHLVQPVQRPADMQNTGAEINILPAQAKQFPKPQAGKKNETDKHAVAVLIS